VVSGFHHTLFAMPLFWRPEDLLAHGFVLIFVLSNKAFVHVHHQKLFINALSVVYRASLVRSRTVISFCEYLFMGRLLFSVVALQFIRSDGISFCCSQNFMTTPEFLNTNMY
jgi:hypothetical protein